MRGQVIGEGSMIFKLVFMILIFFIIICIFGKGLLIRLKGDQSLANAALMGFLLYFSLFQLLAFPMTLLQRSLTDLLRTWSIAVLVICLFFVTDKRFWKNSGDVLCALSSKSTKWLILIMTVLWILQSWIMVNSIGSLYDIAYYVGEVNSSVYTDTMWIYDGSSGMKCEYLPIRYAISSFWTHDALLAKLFAIHGTVVCRYFNSLVLSVLSTVAVYAMAREIFDDKNNCYMTVIFWILANMGATEMYHQNNFLLFRAMENKSYCCNLLIPIVITLILRIWKKSNEKSDWVCLFIANIAGVAISGTAMILVPVLVGCCLCGHWIQTRKSIDFWRMVGCLVPCVVYIMIYAACAMGLQIKVVV